MSTIASALDFGERNKVVMSELDFPTDGHVWLAHAKRGVEIEWLRSPDGLTIPLEEYDRAIDERTAVVMVNRVLYRSSAIVDAKEVCRIARERGALSFLDDYHGIGIVPLDLHDVGCDAYAAGVLKWLCGGPGLAFLYVRRGLIPSLEPMVTGWFGTAEPFSFDTQHLEYHPTARRFEHGTPPAPVFFIAQGGLDVIGEVTPERIRARQGELGDHVIARADELGSAGADPAGPERARRRRERGRRPRGRRRSATRCSNATCAPTTGATACGSARTSSTPRRTSTAASRSCGRCSDRRYAARADLDGDALHRVVREPAEVPRRLERLLVARRVGRPAAELDGAGSRIPVERPGTPRVGRDRIAELRGRPGRAPVRAHLDPLDRAPPGPRASAQARGGRRPRCGSAS